MVEALGTAGSGMGHGWYRRSSLTRPINGAYHGLPIETVMTKRIPALIILRYLSVSPGY